MTSANSETERRFLVRGGGWRHAGDARHILQGYLSTDPARVVRVRLCGQHAWLTIKGSPDAAGTRTEIECPIPADTALAILTHPDGLCIGTVLEKTRARVRVGDLVWEVDEFAGRNQGLCIAEVEHDGALPLDSWRALVDSSRPEWAGREITGEPRFANSSLAQRPFDEWTARERAGIEGG